MLSVTIWWVGISLEALIVLRVFQNKLFSRYPFFFAYILLVLASTSILYAINVVAPQDYRDCYWAADGLTLIAGYGIILEILKHVLSPYPGAERFARISGLVVFGAIFAFVLVYPWAVPGASLAGTMFELERDLRGVQAIFLFGTLVVVSHYGIAIGRNMKGMIFGYGLYVGSSLMMLATRSYAGDSFYNTLKIVQPLSWNISLVIWASALWSFYPNPAPRPAIRLEEDYEIFASRTRNTVGAMRSYLVRVPRP
jgi:hypothetical protein